YEERQVDRIPTEAIGATTDDRGRRLVARYRGPRHPELPDRGREQCRRHRDQHTSDGQTEGVSKEGKWPRDVEHRSREKRSQNDERRPNDGIGDARGGGVTRLIAG